MRLFQRFDRVKIKYFDDALVKKIEESAFTNYDLKESKPMNNTKLFTTNGETYLWTVDGCYNIKTGEKKFFSGDKVVNSLQLLEDNQPYVEKRDDGNWESHPSYGLISLTETTGMSPLFGAPLEYNHYVTLRIKRAMKRDGDYKEEYFHDRSSIVEVRMSFVQLAELMFRSNHGDGVPCTIAWSEMDGYIFDPPYRNYLDTIPEQFDADVRKGMNALESVIDEIKTSLKDKKSFTKAYVGELLDKIECANRTLVDHSAYYSKRFAENIADVKSAVMVEANARINANINAAISDLVKKGDNQSLLVENFKNKIGVLFDENSEENKK